MSVDTSTDDELTSKLNKEDIWSYRNEVFDLAFDLSEVGLIEALPGTGKSRGSMEWAAKTGQKITLLAPRHDLLDEEYTPWCDNFNLTHYRLPSFYRDCDSFEVDDEGYNPVDMAAEELQSDYQAGFNGKKVHKRNPDSTCQQGEKCTYLKRLSFNPSDFDVLLGTYRHAHREEWIENRNVVFDEFPGSAFLTTFNGKTEEIISAYLQDVELPFDSFRDLLLNRDSAGDARIHEWKSEQHTSLSDTGHVRRSSQPVKHTLAPMATLALLEGEFLANNWLYADLGNGKRGTLNPQSNNWTFLLPPNLSEAKSVVGLDGTPNEGLWEQTLNEDVQSLPLLNREGKQEYIQNILGLDLIQTTRHWKAINSGDGAAPPKDLALLEGVAQRAGESPAIISSQDALRQYRQNGLDSISEKVEHYNNLKGMNTFEEERVGVILGSPHPGDGKIQKWCAFAGESAKVKTVDGEELRGSQTDYGEYGNQVMNTFLHDEVLQAAMRFGRKDSDGTKGATVYIHTCAFPEWLPIETHIADIQSWNTEKDGMKDTIDAIQSLEEWKHVVWSSTSLYDNTSISNYWVRDRLDDLVDQGYINFEGRQGQGGTKHYTNICLGSAGSFGHVEFKHSFGTNPNR